MESLTKKRISKYEAKQLFEESGIGIAESINEINESEFSSVFKVTSGGKVYYIKFGPDPEAQTLFYEKDLINVELRVHAILDAHASESRLQRQYLAKGKRRIYHYRRFRRSFERTDFPQPGTQKENDVAIRSGFGKAAQDQGDRLRIHANRHRNHLGGSL